METVRDLRPEVRQTLERAEKFLGPRRAGRGAARGGRGRARGVALSAPPSRCRGDVALLRRAAVRRRSRCSSSQFLVLGVARVRASGVVVALGGPADAGRDARRRCSAARLPPPTWVPGARRRSRPACCCCSASRCRRWSRSRTCRRCACCAAICRGRAPAACSRTCSALATIALLIAWQAREAQAGSIMVGGVGGLLLVAGAARVGAARAAEAPAAARRHVALRPRQPAPARVRVEPADRRARARTDGAAAADRRARRPHAQLAREPAARCAEPVPGQRAARSGRRRARDAVAARRRATIAFRPMVRGRLVEVNGAAARHDASYERHARAPPRRARVQPVVDRHAARRQSRRRAARSGRRDARGDDAGMSLEDGIAESLGVKLGDSLTFDIAGNARVGEGDEPAQGRLGQLPREFLRAVSARAARRHAGDLHRGVPRAGGRQRVARARWCRSIRTSSRSTSARSCGRCRASWTACRARSSSCSCSRSPAGCSCCRRRSPRRRTSASSTRRSCARSARRSGSCAAAQIAEFLLLGALAGLVGGGRRDGDRLGARRPRVQDSVRRPIRCVWLYGIVGGALAVTLAGWLGTRSTVRQPPLAVIRQLG